MTAVVASSMDVDASASTSLRAYYDAKIEALSVALRTRRRIFDVWRRRGTD